MLEFVSVNVGEVVQVLDQLAVMLPKALKRDDFTALDVRTELSSPSLRSLFALFVGMLGNSNPTAIKAG